MGDTAILVEGVSKRYRIGQRAKYKALRDTLTGAVKAPFTKLRSALSNSNGDGRRVSQGEDHIWALRDICFEVRHGDVLGIIGRNGAGKSTLLKILSRITAPTAGYVELRGRVGSLLEVGTGFHPELSGRENIFLNGAILGMTRREIKSKFDQIVDFAEVDKFVDTPVKHYSSGMYVRLAFAVAAHLEPEILLVDEVLAVGDVAFQKKCLGKMGEVAKAGRTVLFVSHNMSAIHNLCTTGVFLNQGVVQVNGCLQKAIESYQGQSTLNEITYSAGPIRRASVRQIEHSIEIQADYELEEPLRLPCLGFVISDSFGNPICGSNPTIDAVFPTHDSWLRGRVRTILEHPRLLNGTYRLSLWFGGGNEDFFEARDCLTFEIVNMTNTKQLSPTIVGRVSPSCRWYFE